MSCQSARRRRAGSEEVSYRTVIGRPPPGRTICAPYHVMEWMIDGEGERDKLVGSGRRLEAVFPSRSSFASASNKRVVLHWLGLARSERRMSIFAPAFGNRR